MKTIAISIIAFSLFAHYCLAQSSKPFRFYFNNNKEETRTYFKNGDTSLTCIFIGGRKGSDLKYKIDKITMRIYLKKSGRDLSVPIMDTIPASKIEKIPQITIPLKGKIDYNTDSFTININGVYEYNTKGIKKRLPVSRGHLYAQFIQAVRGD